MIGPLALPCERLCSMKATQDSHPSWEDLAAFELGRLSDGDWTVVADHLNQCEICSSRLDTVPQDAFVALLRSAVTDGKRPPSALATPTEAVVTLPAAAARETPQLPEELTNHPRYRVLGPLGSGGMGMVFKAEHVLMERIVALKVLHRGLLAHPAAVERFFREVKALARLSHPNIVTAYDAEQTGEVLFLVMEYAEGESLDRILCRCGTLPVALSQDWIRQTALGLQFAFEKGLVHRDLKPANLLLAPQGQVKILDFGLARLRGETAGDAGQTPDGAVVGTLDYVAPEQARDPKTADIRADLYSLGCTWYEMLTGRSPFRGGTALQQLLAHQDQIPRPVAHYRADVPAGVNAILERLLAKDPARRFQTPTELLTALDEADSFASPVPSSRRIPRQWIGALLGILCLLFGFLLIGGVGWYGYQAWRASASRGEQTALPKMEERKNPAEESPKPILSVPSEKRRSTHEQTVAWLKANNSFGPDHKIVHDSDRQLGSSLSRGEAFVLWLGPKLVKSGKPTVLAGRHCDLRSFEFSQESRPIADTETVLITTPHKDQAFHPELPVALSNLQIDEKNNLDSGREITGSVAYRTATPVSGTLSVRVTFVVGKKVNTYYSYWDKNNFLDGQGILPFHFHPQSSSENRLSGLNVLFVEVCSLNDPATKAHAFQGAAAGV
jgi:serine/threonine protein kinase